jgi:hypothetical protein
MSNVFGKAIKKPVEIDFCEADDVPAIIRWTQSFNDEFDEHFSYNISTTELKVKTLEGSSYNVPEDYYIIRGVRGEYYPIEGKIFRETYDIQ